MRAWKLQRLFGESGAPDALLGIEGGEHYRLVVDAGSVAVDGGCGLGAEVAVAEIEVESADVVGAVSTGELHAAFDAGDGVEAFHNSSVVFWRGSDRHGGGAAKVMPGWMRKLLGELGGSQKSEVRMKK